MDQKTRKQWIIDTLETGDFESIHDAYLAVGGLYHSLEGMPFGLRTLPNHITDDFDAGRISARESVVALLDAVRKIPDVI